MMTHQSPQRHAPRFALSLVLFLALAALSPAAGLAAPEPSVTDQSWRLDFSYQMPDAVALETADGEVQWYWYLPYKVVNNTDQKQLFVPEVTITDNTGRVVEADTGISPRVFEKIKEKLNNPLLRSPTAVAGTLLVGEDHAKESVAIWPASPKDVDSFRIFIGGLSGET